MIYIDADACPVKAEVERVGTRHWLKMFVVSNGGIRPSANPLVETVVVPDTTPPTVTTQTPQDGASDISIGATVSAVFDEAMDAATIDSNAFELRDPRLQR